MPEFTPEQIVDAAVDDIAESYHDLNDGDGPFAGIAFVQPLTEDMLDDLDLVEIDPHGVRVFPQDGDIGVAILVAAIRRPKPGEPEGQT